MGMNHSRLAYQDCYDLLEKAISEEYPTGLRVKFATQNEATHFRQRVHHARQVDRMDNTQTYPQGHIMFGRSVYDVINCRIRGTTDGWWLRFERTDAREFEIEPLEKPEAGVPLPPPASVVVQDGDINLVVPMVPIQRKFPRRA